MPGAGSDAARRGDREGQRRQEAADRRTRRDQRHRGGAAAAAQLRQRRSSTISSCPRSLADNVLDKDTLCSDYAKRGIALHRQIEPSLSFTFFNMDDPVVGGYTPEKIALRRAITMGYDRKAEIEVLRHGQASPRRSSCRPGSPGHDPTLRRARPLRSRGGTRAARQVRLQGSRRRRLSRDARRQAVDDHQGVTRRPTIDRTENELWKRSMDAIGIRIAFFTQKWPELNKMSEAGQLQMWGLSWIATIRRRRHRSRARCTARTSERRTTRAFACRNTIGSTRHRSGSLTDPSAPRSTAR